MYAVLYSMYVQTHSDIHPHIAAFYFNKFLGYHNNGSPSRDITFPVTASNVKPRFSV